MTKLQIKHRFISTIFRDTNTTHIYNKQNIWEKKSSWYSVDNWTFIYAIPPSWFPNQQMIGFNKFDHLTPFWPSIYGSYTAKYTCLASYPQRKITNNFTTLAAATQEPTQEETQLQQDLTQQQIRSRQRTRLPSSAFYLSS